MDRTEIVEKLRPVAKALATYHRYRVIGLENIPTEGGALIACNHSLATYDIALLMAAIYDKTGRLPRSLIDRAFYKVPGLGELMEFFGAVQGSQDNAEKLLADGELLTVAPGGMREALKPSGQRYQIRWNRRKGFAKLSIRAQVPVILAACPKADDLYDVYPSRITAWVYRNYRFPVFFARGLGPTPIPRPVKLTHLLSEPIHPPPMPESEEEFDRVVNEYHKSLIERMKALISQVIQDYS